MKVNNNVGQITRALGDKESQIKRVTDRYQEKVELVKDRVEKNGEQLTALRTLQNLVRNYTNAASSLQSVEKNPFVSNNASITTNDNGAGANYIDVTLGAEATKGSFNVSVDQIATASKMVIEGGGAHGAIADNPGLSGTLTITVTGTDNVVNISAVDSVTQIIANINTQFTINGVKAEALAIKTNDGTFIEIRHKEAGVNALVFDWDKFGVGDDLAQKSYTIGTTAKITVDGVQSEQATNVFKDILPGVTVNATTVNTATKFQTVNVINDSGKAVKQIALLGNAYNELSIFVAKMTEKVGKQYAETAVLNGTAELRQAQDLLASFSTSMVNTDGEFKSLNSVGIEVGVDLTLKDVPAGTKTLKINEIVLANAINNNFEDFTNLFRGASSFVSHGANQGSVLSFVNLTKLLSTNVLNKDITVTAKVNAGVVDPEVDVDIDGIRYTGAFANGMINFPTGSPLAGLILGYDVKAVGTHNEIFTMKLTQGLADVAFYKSSELVSKDGLGGTVIAGVERLQKSMTKLEDEQKSVEDIIKKKTAEIDSAYDRVGTMDLMTEMMMEFVKEAINPSDG